jgi:hypothetical protein
VCKLGLHDPKINCGYAEAAAVTGAGRPGAASHPRNKAVIETQQRYVRSGFFAGHSSVLLAQAADAQ